MGILGNIFGGSTNKDSEETNIRWIDLTDRQHIDDIVQASHEVPVFIFKHSTRCAVSKMALKQFEKHYDPELPARGYFLDLLAHRDISDEIAERFGVVHQSPQIILVREGKCVFTESHSEIDAEDLAKKIKR